MRIHTAVLIEGYLYFNYLHDESVIFSALDTSLKKKNPAVNSLIERRAFNLSKMSDEEIREIMDGNYHR